MREGRFQDNATKVGKGLIYAGGGEGGDGADGDSSAETLTDEDDARRRDGEGVGEEGNNAARVGDEAVFGWGALAVAKAAVVCRLVSGILTRERKCT